MARHDLSYLLDRAHDTLASWEMARCARMSHPRAREMRIAAHVFKRMSVAEALGVHPADVKIVESSGAPALAPPHEDVHVSLSHTETAVAVALSAHAVGIDVERMRRGPDWRGFAERRFAPGEADHIAASDDPALAFTRLWCAKEALLKARGLTLGQVLRLDCAGITETPVERHGARVRTWSPAPDVCCALAEAL